MSPTENGAIRRDLWRIVDARTDRTVGVSAYPSRESAELMIAHFVERDQRGKRQDIHDLIPHLTARPLKDGDW